MNVTARALVLLLALAVEAADKKTLKCKLYNGMAVKGWNSPTFNVLENNLYIKDGQCDGMVTSDLFPPDCKHPYAISISANDTFASPYAIVHNSMQRASIYRLTSKIPHASCNGKMWVHLGLDCGLEYAPTRRVLGSLGPRVLPPALDSDLEEVKQYFD